MKLDTVFCVASGPSLTKQDCLRVEASGFPIIAVNNAFRLFDKPYALFAGDASWWRQYGHLVPKNTRKCTASLEAKQNYGIEYHRFGHQLVEFNSGSMAIQFAASLGARTIYLLGYDCSLSHGVHFHGVHPEGLRNPSEISVVKWQEQFLGVSQELKHLNVYNCSRRTALACFPLKNLDTVIGSSS